MLHIETPTDIENAVRKVEYFVNPGFQLGTNSSDDGYTCMAGEPLLKQVLNNGIGFGMCAETAFMAGLLTESIGLPPIYISMEITRHGVAYCGHGLLLRKEGGGYGAYGNSRLPCLRSRLPIFGTPDELIDSYRRPLLDVGLDLRQAHLVDLHLIPRENCDWRTSEENIGERIGMFNEARFHL